MFKAISSTILVAVGVGICTYAYTRYSMTHSLLVEVQSLAEAFLEKHNLLRGPTNNDVEILEELNLESRAIIGEIGLAGGMYYWWNDSLPYYGVGTLMIIVGLLLPVLEKRKKPPEVLGTTR